MLVPMQGGEIEEGGIQKITARVSPSSTPPPRASQVSPPQSHGGEKVPCIEQEREKSPEVQSAIEWLFGRSGTGRVSELDLRRRAGAEEELEKLGIKLQFEESPAKEMVGVASAVRAVATGLGGDSANQKQKSERADYGFDEGVDEAIRAAEEGHAAIFAVRANVSLQKSSGTQGGAVDGPPGDVSVHAQMSIRLGSQANDVAVEDVLTGQHESHSDGHARAGSCDFEDDCVLVEAASPPGA